MEAAEVSQYWLTRFLIQRSLGFIYLIGFLIVVNQYIPLVGEKGLLPIRHFLPRIGFWDAPSIFSIHHSDTFLKVMGFFGLGLSILAVTGISESHGIWFSVCVWFLLWVVYLSFVNAGQTFYGFGWEILLLEAGFLAIFLGSSDRSPPVLVIWLYRWLLFRVMFGAGMIKLRGDECWRDLTCMVYHYETQPLPNPLSFFMHRFPLWLHKAEVLFNHFIELVVPWFLFIPRTLGAIAGGFTLLFQFILIISGNLSWLNYITLVLTFSCFDDRILSKIIPIKVPETTPLQGLQEGAVILLGCLVAFLSIRPTLNLFSKYQAMNRSYDALHLVNTYGAFGSVTKARTEIIFEGTEDPVITPATKWKEYEFKAKPGDPKRSPPIISPYHYKLDWQIWFAAMSDYQYHPWILNLTYKLLKNDKDTLSLIKYNPFPEEAPKHIRALHYDYRFATFEEKKETSQWWIRRLKGEYLPALSLKDQSFRDVLERNEWLEE